ncbi:hypothetical protein CFK38_02245 [Brachybacterium vulturis]|uniref:DUF1648 domain-containing protein n=1 Tax=Brachybacterium vulturis TaxID=2017484 RepID=A0A291GIW8_9MICO|nr:DUF1648 domain-containing protein [Brachybacterium vulturis]ATG50473.1 hypothetical protein CFK38_02245 [Brachybacterium vulturis]
MTSSPRTAPDVPWRRHLSAGVLLLPFVLTLSAAVILWGRLPDPMPSHWNVRGAVDGTMPRPLFLGLMLLGGVATGGIGAVIVGTGRADRARSSLTLVMGFLAWLFCGIAISAMVVAAGSGDADEAVLPTWLLVLLTVGPVLPALLLHTVLPRSEARPGPDTGRVPMLDLKPGERAVWVGRTRSLPLLLIGLILVALGGGLLLTAPAAGVPVLVVGLVLIAAHQITVRADRSGVRVSWGPQQWPRHTYALEAMTAAEPVDIDPLQWGGWGYRRSRRGIGLVLRRGPGLLLRRDGLSDVAITVDDASSAAGLVNALAQRSRDSGTTGSAPPDGV